MNLRVDLILDTEKRSGSLVTSKGALRILSVVVPVILLGILAGQFLIVSQLNQELTGIKLTYDSALPQQEKAKALIAEFQTHRDLQAEFTGWSHSRMAWSEQLQGVMTVVPTNIHLQELTSAQTLQLTNDKPARLFTLTMRGTAVSSEAEQSVKSLESRLITAPAFTSLTASVTVPVYGANTEPGANRDERVFQIVCQYAQRVFQ
ncbi:MAG: hypothetical protein K8T26_12010 [Lentisphaerae bacterium]|nr:hypothetical protein [Lentisphaerota bacterium]